jgi:polar amino acid transport system substrate-binding protein
MTRTGNEDVFMNSTKTHSRVADIVRNDKIRIGLFPSFFYRAAAGTGELQGVGIEIARVLAAKIGVELVIREYANPPSVVQALKAGECDVAFLGIDPLRASEIDFTLPYMQADFTFLVPEGSSIDSINDVNRSGTRIAVVRNHAMASALQGKLNAATLIYAETPDAAFDLLRSLQADVLAGIRPGLFNYAALLTGSRVLEDSYGTNILALAVAKGQPERLSYLSDFIEDVRTTGLVRRAIESAGLRGIQAIPS